MSVRNGLLALLGSGGHHGYELKKELEERTGALWELNVGQVYTTLSRLERDGLVVEAGTAPAGHGSQDQRLYALTDAGRREVDGWFARPRTRPAPDRDELVIKLTLAASLDDVDLDGVIDAQQVATTEELQRYTRLKAAADPEDLARLFALDAVIAQIDGELRWLEQCRQRHDALRPKRSRPRGAEKLKGRR
ncbi:MAG: PadR family transcriptional regulator [Actinobacteria bacterium]|nr:PadR family transcriptional regulator [Actinomycetota bacterium]